LTANALHCVTIGTISRPRNNSFGYS
jgi:hypothetical protein